MKYLTYERDGETRVGVLRRDRITRLGMRRI